MSSAPSLMALAHTARQRFCAQVGALLPKLGQDVRDHINGLMDRAVTARDMQTARDALVEFDQLSRTWMDGVRAAWQQSLQPQPSEHRGHTVPGRLELLPLEAQEDQILASKLVQAVLDVCQTDWSDLQVRLLYAENRSELRNTEQIRPETLAKSLLEEWVYAGLSREHWVLLSPVIHGSCGEHWTQAYQAANRFLAGHGVLATLEPKRTILKSPAGIHAVNEGLLPTDPRTLPTPGSARPTKTRPPDHDMANRLQRLLASRLPPRPAMEGGFPTTLQMAYPLQTPGHRPGLDLLLNSPLPAGTWDGSEAAHPAAGSNPLIQVRQVSDLLQQRSAELKQSTPHPGEKATIEVVALMFQSILTEDRIPASLRIWFARLQIPVLRVALKEPDFFSSLQHPARRLIDRMGSCALGFDAQLAELTSHALEVEIRRVVQVIEQYPDTGRRVFQLVLDEFQKFLAKHLQSQGPTEKLVSVAQQVEQKETLAVQYTIQLRKQLDDMPVSEPVRGFLFKVWAEVLAVATVKFGAKHPDMVALKQTASDLLWAASAKPTRTERAQAISQMPGLLTRLRKGMGLLGLEPSTQEQHIKALSDTMADAFMSRTENIPAAQLEAVTRHLSALEDFLPQTGVSDLELNQENIEMITGVDASHIEVITAGDISTDPSSRDWAQGLQLGTWYHLSHNTAVSPVQLAWRSERGQLCLFTSAHQRCYLIQSTRLAAHLQAGLLVPIENETLTVRATRAALEKLEANPDLLLD